MPTTTPPASAALNPSSNPAAASPLDHALQQVALLATGNATSAGGLAFLHSLVQADSHLQVLIDTVNGFMGQRALAQGTASVIQDIGRDALGLELSGAQAAELATYIDGGSWSWAELFVACMSAPDALGQTLHQRADAAQGFVAQLQAMDKAAYFDGAAVYSAVKALLQGVGADGASASAAQGSLAALAANLTATGIVSTVVDGYLSGATVFMDTNGDGALSAGEWSTTTDAAGRYELPRDAAGGTLIALGGTDLMTGKAFTGVLTAPLGATYITPLTTLAQALLAQGALAGAGAQAGALAAAALVQGALGLQLPGGVSLLNYDPLAVLASAQASAADKAAALAVQAAGVQVVNVIAQGAAAISAATGAAPLAAGEAVIGALAGALASGQGLPLTNTAALAGVLQAAGAGTQAQQVAQITAASNAAAAGASNITQLAQSAAVAQSGAVAAIASGAAAGNLAGAVAGFTGSALDKAIAQAETGWINPEVPVPAPGPAPAPAPGPAPGPAPAPTFTATLDTKTGALTFGGTATGTITFSVDADGLATFTRGGVVATQKLALASVQGTGLVTIKLSAAAANVSVATAQKLTSTWVDMNGKTYSIQDSAANILEQLASAQSTLPTVLNQATAITSSDGALAMTAAQFTLPGLAAKLADGAVTLALGAGGATAAQLALIAAAIDKVADGGITGTLDLAKLGTVDASGYFSALLGKVAVNATVNVDAQDMTAAELTALSKYIAKVDAITHLSLTSAQSAQEIENLLSKAVGAVVDLNGMNAAQLAAVWAAMGDMPDGSISAITLTGAQFQAMHDAGTLDTLAAGSVTVSGALSDEEKALVIEQIDKIATDGISAITLTEAQASSDLLGHAAFKDGSVTIGAITSANGKAAVLAALDKIATDGITAITLTPAEATAQVLSSAGLKDGSVTLDGTVDVAYLTAIGVGASKLAADSITALSFANDAALQAASELIASDAVAAGSITLTSGAISTATATVLDNLGKFQANQITTITLTDAQAKVAGTLASAAFADGSVTIGAVTDSKAMVLANLGKIAEDGISAITLTLNEATIDLLQHAALADGSVTFQGKLDFQGIGLFMEYEVLGKIAEGGITALTLEALASLGMYVDDDELPVELLADGAVVWGQVTAGSEAAALKTIRHGKAAVDSITAITLTEEQATAAVLASAALKDGSVTIGAVTDTSQAAVLAALDKMAAEGITAITLTTQQATAEVLSHPAFKNGSVTLNGTVDQDYLDSLGSAASKLATGSITGMTFANDAELQSAAQLIASDSVGDNAIALTDGAITTAKATVLANLGKFQAGQITAITLTDAEAKVAGTLVSDALNAGSVTIGAVADSKALVLANLGKIATDGISAITLTKSQATTLLDNAVLQTGSVTISDAVDNAYYTGLSTTQLAKLAPGGITKITLTKAQAELAFAANAALFKDGSVTISDAVDKAYLDTLEAGSLLAKIAVGGITKITLTEAQATADFLANPILKAKSVTIGAVTDTSKEVVLGTLGMIAKDGITAITLTKSEARAIGTTEKAAFKDKSVTIEEKITGISDIPISQGKIAAGGIKQIDLTGETSLDVDYFESSFGDMYAQRSITFGAVEKQTITVIDHRVNQNAQQAVLKGSVAKGGITAIDLSFQGAMRVLRKNGGDKEAFKDGAITVGATGWAATGGTGAVETSYTGAYDIEFPLQQLDIVSIKKLAAPSVLQYIDHFASGQITSFMFTKDQATAALLDKAALADGSVTLSDAVDGAYLTSLDAEQLAKIAEGGITAITLTQAQASEFLGNPVLKDGSVTLSGAVDGAYLAGLSDAQLTQLATDGISAVALTPAQASAELLGHAAFKAGSVTLSAAVDGEYLVGLGAAASKLTGTVTVNASTADLADGTVDLSGVPLVSSAVLQVNAATAAGVTTYQLPVGKAIVDLAALDFATSTVAIQGFTAGAVNDGGDQLKVSGANLLGVIPVRLLAVVHEAGGSRVSVGSGDILRVTDAGEALTADTIAALFDSSAVFNIEMLNLDDKFFMVTSQGALWSIDMGRDGDSHNVTAGDIQAVGSVSATLTGSSGIDLSTLLLENFI